MTTEELVKRLEEASAAYYNGEAIMSDAEFDALRDQLIEQAPDHPFLKVVGAPATDSAWEKRTHTTTMLSQDKVNTKEEWEHWAKKMQSKKVALSHKIDGATVVLTYADGDLQYAVTRGDGFEGDDITPNVLKMQGVKTKLDRPFTGDIRGEIVLPFTAFDEHFVPLGYMNPRNSVNVMKDQKDKNGLVKYLKVIPFEVVSPETNGDIQTEEDMEKFVKELGLNYVDTWYMDADQVWDFFEQFDRNAVPYLLDGMIARICDIAEQKAMGFTSHHPNGSVAIKFEAEGAQTTILNIEWNLGLSGRVCPVANIEMIELAGAKIRRATLHNPDFIAEHNIEVGDKVFIIRANDVIPKVISLIAKGDSDIGTMMPTHCPKCEAELVKEGAHLTCPNESCEGRVFGTMMKWIKVHKLLGFGRTRMRDIVAAGINTPDKLYSCTQEELAAAVNSTRIAEKLKEELEKAKEVELGKFLAGLHIDHLGRKNGKRLQDKFRTLKAVLEATPYHFAEVPGIGQTAEAIWTGLDEKMPLIVALLEQVSIKEVEEEVAATSNALDGKKFCMTGLRKINDQPIADMVYANGGKVASGVSKGLDYLIVKNKDKLTNKLKKALDLGVVLLSPEEFLEMINHG